MQKGILYLILVFSVFPLMSCQRSNNNIVEVDNNSYISDFELVQKNQDNDSIIKIISPKAIIDNFNNGIKIFDSSIEISNKNLKDIIIKSGNANLNNIDNIIKVFNNVNISLVDSKNYFVNTESFIWDLSKSSINLDKPLNIDLDNTNITSSSGSYNIKLGELKIMNNYFNRSIFNNDGNEKYQIEIKSDVAKWIKNENTLEFKSNNKQVETTINILNIK